MRQLLNFSQGSAAQKVPNPTNGRDKTQGTKETKADLTTKARSHEYEKS